MRCKAYECEDSKESIGPDGECHDFEQQHEELSKEHAILSNHKKAQDIVIRVQKNSNEELESEKSVLEAKQKVLAASYDKLNQEHTQLKKVSLECSQSVMSMDEQIKKAMKQL